MKRNLKMILASLFVGIFAATGLLIPAFADDGEYSGPIRVFVLDDDSLKVENSAPYDVNSLKSLFEGAGYVVKVINAKELACVDDFNAKLCDVLMIPTGEAFPAKAEVNFKNFLIDGGKLITSGGYAFKNTVYSSGSIVSSSGGKALCITSPAVGESHSVTHRFGKDVLKPGESYTIEYDIKYSDIDVSGGLAHASLYFYGNGGNLVSWKDFMSLTEGENDWTTISYSFSVPSNATETALNLGFFQAKGKTIYDNITIKSSSGKTVYTEDFEDGTKGWSMVTGSWSNVSEEVGINVGGDSVITISNTTGYSSLAKATWSIDKNVGKEIEVRLESRFEDKSGMSLLNLLKDGKQVYSHMISHGEDIDRNTPLTRRVTLDVSEYDFDTIEFELNVLGAGKAYFDNIEISVDGKSVFENEGTLDGAKVETANNNTVSVEKIKAKPIGLSTMEPNYIGDLLLYPDYAVPLFDIETKYDDAVRISAAEGQSIFADGDHMTVTGDERITGYSAITVTGNYRGRWQPLLYAYDDMGQRVGTVGAIFRVFVQPSNLGALGLINTWKGYEGTSIGFFGVNSHDLFAEKNTSLREGLVNLVETLCSPTYISGVENYYDCYRQGEEPRVIVNVENTSNRSVKNNVEVTIRSEDTGEVVFSGTKEVKVSGNGRRAGAVVWENAGEFTDDFYYVEAVLKDEEGKILDKMNSGFVVWNDEVIKNGPNYTYKDNYINIKNPDGTETSVFASGVDDGANLFINEDQTPLAWLESFERRVDTGMYIYENLQQSPAYGDFAFLFDNGTQWEKHLRTVDTVVYLSQRYGQIYMMGLAIGANTAKVEELDKMCEYVSEFAERYKDVNGIIYYLNGDLVCEPSQTANAQFREFLKNKYKTDEAFKKAWKNTSYTLDTVKYDTTYNFGGNGWTDVKAYDQNLFRAELVKKWSTALKASIDAKTGGDRLVLCEYWAYPYSSVDVAHVIGDLGYSNIGFFDSIEKFAQTLANADQRWQGKSFGIGETNKRTHPGYNATASYYASATYEESRAYFFTTYYTTYAMGGNHYQLWCFNDESKYTFSWGMNTGGEHAPRDLFYWMRNANFVTKSSTPKYTTPEIAVITPDSTRLGGSLADYSNHYSALNAFDIAQRMLVDGILTLNESNFAIPDGIKVIYYPMSYTMPDDVFEKLTSWVENGGVLYISGDFSYDITRDRTKEDRLTSLAGVKVTKVNFKGTDKTSASVKYSNGTFNRTGNPNVDLELVSAEALYSTSKGVPVITKNKLGGGYVIYSADPIEMNCSEQTMGADIALYKSVLELAGVKTAAIKPNKADVLKYFKLALDDGGSFHEIINTSDQPVRAEQTIGENKYSFSLLANFAGYIRANAENGVTALMYNGMIERNGSMLVDNDCLAVIMSLDGIDIESSKSLIVLPQAEGAFAYQTATDWADVTVISGQIYDRQFIGEKTVDFEYSDKGRIKLNITAEDVNKIFIITSKSNTEIAVADTLMIMAGSNAKLPIQTETSNDDDLGGKSSLKWLYVVLGVVGALAVATTALVLGKKKKK